MKNVMISALVAMVCALSAFADDCEIVASRYVSLFADGRFSSGEKFPEPGVDGLFADVDYSSPVRAHWPPGMVHLPRLRKLVGRWLQTRDAKALEDVHRAFLGWVRRNPLCPNWWWNDIGVPGTVGWCALALGDELKDEERDYAIRMTGRRKLGDMTGQNRAWLAQMRMMRGLLRKDADEVAAAVKVISEEVRMAPVGKDGSVGEGVQSDGCFHQHGHQPQFGNYGQSFFSLQTKMAELFAGTRFAYSREQLGVLQFLAENGFQWILWKGSMDVSAINRQLYQGDTRTREAIVEASFRRLGRLGWKRPPAPTGFRYFDQSAYAVYRAKDWMASVRASTPKIVGVETWINEDNVKGMCMADGALFVYSTGREYEDIYPLWDDWRMIPGVTGYLGRPVHRKNAQNEADDIAASKSAAGDVLELTFRREGLSVHKKWTFSPDGILCEGSGITADAGDYEVATCVEHALADRAEKVLETPEKSVFRNGDFRYTVFAPPEAIRFSVEERRGDFRDHMRSEASSIVTGRVFSLRIVHGRAPKNGAYRYRITLNRGKSSPDRSAR